MELKKIDQKQYDEFAISLGQEHFLHTFSWAKAREKINWQYEVVGLFDSDNIVGAATILFKKAPYISQYYAYIPRGMIIDYNNQKLVKKWTNEMKKYLKSKKVFCLTIDPDLILNTLDEEYNIIEHYEDVEEVMNILDRSGYVHKGFLNNFEGTQPRHTFRMNLKGKTYEEIISNMAKKTKYNVNTSKKFGLDIREGSVEDLEDFMKIMDETTKRDGFTSRDINYYKNIMEEFKENVKLSFVSINPKKVYSTYKETLTESETLIEEILKDIKEEDLSKKARLRLTEARGKVKKSKERMEELEPFLEQENVDLATSFVILCNKRAWYVYGASSSTLRNYLPNYFSYDNMIKNVINLDCEYLDLFGVGGELNPESSIHGIYVMKKGFGGNLIEFIGEYDLVINKLYYFIYKNIFPILKNLKKKK